MTFPNFLREGVRFYKRNRLLAVCAILILAVGMGASSVTLNVLWALSHPKTPGIRPGSYTTVGEYSPGAPLQPISWHTLLQLRAAMPGIALGAYAPPTALTAQSGARSVEIRVAGASSDIFEKFADHRAAGRGFSEADEESPSGNLVLSFDTAQDLFGSPSEALGKSVRVSGVALQVTGVASKAFRGILQQEAGAWVPPRLAAQLRFAKDLGSGNGWKTPTLFYALLASPTGDAAQGTADIARRLRTMHDMGPTLTAVAGLTTDPERIALLKAWSGLASFVAVLLELASGLSFGGLLLARAPRQLDEVRLRRTLGAGSVRLVLDLISGPVWVVAGGFLGALALAASSMEAIRHRLGEFMPSVSFSFPEILLAILAQLPLALGIMIIMGSVPALRLLRDSGAPRLGYSGTGTKRSGLLLQAIVVVQVVCCICACLVATVVGRSVMELGRQTLGYEPANRSVLAVSFKVSGSFTTNSSGGFPLASAFDRTIRRVGNVPGVTGVAVALVAPLDPAANSILLTPVAGPGRSVSFNGVTSNYFQVLGTPLTAGHVFSSRLDAGDPNEVVINETLRKQISPDTSPIGKTVRLEHAFGWSLVATVVGVAADQRMAGPKESVPPTVFLPLSGSVFASNLLRQHLIIDGHAPLFRLEAEANDELSAAFPGLGVTGRYRLDDRLRGLQADEQRRVLFALAGAIAVALVAYIGLYSSLLYFVASKRRELAIRICCGATSGAIFGIVLGRAIRGGAAAALISVLFWVPLRTLVSGGWIGAGSWSLTAAVAATVVCLGAVIAIAVVPALQACRMAPAEVIRGEA